MANKQILNREDSENESVLISEKELDTFLSMYYTVTDLKTYKAEVEKIKFSHAVKRFLGEYKKGEATVKEAIEKAIPKGSEPIWNYIGDTQEEAVNLLIKPWGDRAGEFIENRYPTLSSFFINYLEPLVLAGMRSGELIYTWWRAVNYGFSVTPHTEDEEAKPNAFPYLNVEDMTEDDRRAFRWTVEDVFNNILIECFAFHLLKRGITDEEYKALEDGRIDFYREGGYTKEELLQRYSNRAQSEYSEEDLDFWGYDMELYLPIAIHRLDRALYYATKYNGTEYKDYIKSLNVEEDFNFNRGAGEYKKVMTEGYVWHWEE